MKFSVKNI